MASVIAQISDVHIGGPNPGAGDRFSQAIDAINDMSRQPDLVLVTGDLTHSGVPSEWAEFRERIGPLRARWDAVRGNHDRQIDSFAGHRSIDLDDLHVVLTDTSADQFDAADAAWLEADLAAHAGRPTAIAIHHPPFETGIWWMDCVGLRGAERFEAVVRQNPQVRHVMSGHVHRPITTGWAGCLVTVCPSTDRAIAGDLDPSHDPAMTNEPPMIALHGYLADTVVSHVVSVGPTSARASITTTAPEFVAWARQQQAGRHGLFAER
jgi:3',5'-cyclic AMP phosphodiesterase CpdA